MTGAQASLPATSRLPRRQTIMVRRAGVFSCFALMQAGMPALQLVARVGRSVFNIYSEASLISSGINTASGSVGQCLTGNSRFMVFVFKRNGLKIDR